MARHLVKYFKEISAKRETAFGRKRPKFDNGRKPRGIYHTDPADKEFNDTLKNAGKKLEVHIGFGRPCKLRKKGKLFTHTNARLTNRQESTNQRRNKNHEDHIPVKGFNSLSHDNLVRKPIHVLQARKIQDAKAAFDNEWDKLKNISSWQESKVKS